MRDLNRRQLLTGLGAAAVAALPVAGLAAVLNGSGTDMTIRRYKASDGTWKSRGWPDVSTNPQPPSTPARDSLVYGTYEPDASTTGILPGTTLTAYNSSSIDSFILPATFGATETALGWTTYTGVAGAGKALSNKIIYGDMRPPSAQATTMYFLNCKLVGGNNSLTGNSGLMNCDSSNRTAASKPVVFIDCEFAPRQPDIGRDCIRGRAFQVYRCNIHHGCDGIGIFATTQQGTVNADVTASGNYIHNLIYGYPDNIGSGHVDGNHADVIQHQGGRNVIIKGNALYGTTTLADVEPGTVLFQNGTNSSDPSTYKQKPELFSQGYNAGSGIIVQNNTGQGIDTTTVIEQNWIYGTATQLNIKPNITFIYRNNKHYRETYTSTISGYIYSGYWVRFDTHTSPVIGLNSGTLTNTWMNGPFAGSVLTEGTDRGIHYNA